MEKQEAVRVNFTGMLLNMTNNSVGRAVQAG